MTCIISRIRPRASGLLASSALTSGDFEFDVTSLDEQVEMAEAEARFSAPGDE